MTYYDEDKVRRRRALAEAAVPLVNEHVRAIYNPDSCILQVATLVDVLREFGIAARPESVEMVAGNKVWRDACVAAGGLPAEGDREALWKAGAWTVGVGGAEGEVGHVVATMRNPGLLLDPSLDQASRPEKGMPLGPLVVEIDVATWSRYGATRLVADEVLVDYVAAPWRQWRRSRDWHLRERRARFVKSVVAELRERVL